MKKTTPRREIEPQRSYVREMSKNDKIYFYCCHAENMSPIY